MATTKYTTTSGQTGSERKRRYMKRFETFSEEKQDRQLEIMVRWLIKVIEAQEAGLVGGEL